MQKLTNKEEEVMHVLWRLKKAFVKEIQKEIQKEMGEQAHYNTLSTMVRNLEEKGFVHYNAFGKTHQYYPIITLDVYKKQFINGAINTYFGNSYKNMVSYFAEEQKISAAELREILDLIEKNN